MAMQIYEHPIRETPWNRGHILLAFTWCVLFTSAMMRFCLAAIYLLFDTSAEPLMAFFASGSFLLIAVFLLDILKTHFYFQEIINDFGPNQDAYQIGESGARERWAQEAQELMNKIEDVRTEPVQRQKTRIGLRELIESPSCPTSVRERVMKRHGYLNVDVATEGSEAA